MDTLTSLVVSFIILIVGVVIGWFVARHYYNLSSNDAQLIMESLRHGGFVEYIKNKSGKNIAIKSIIFPSDVSQGQAVDNVDLVAHPPKK